MLNWYRYWKNLKSQKLIGWFKSSQDIYAYISGYITILTQTASVTFILTKYILLESVSAAVSTWTGGKMSRCRLWVEANAIYRCALSWRVRKGPWTAAPRWGLWGLAVVAWAAEAAPHCSVIFHQCQIIAIFSSITIMNNIYLI